MADENGVFNSAAMQALGRIEGQLAASALMHREMSERMTRLESAVNGQLRDHRAKIDTLDVRVREVEIAQAGAGRRAAISGSGAAAAVTAAIEALRHFLR